jgi:hypothetical protein
VSDRHSPGDLAASRRDDLRTLGLLPDSSPGDILQAYLKLRRALRADSVALRAAANENERRAMLQRVEESYLRLCAQAGQPIQPAAFARAAAVGAAARAARQPGQPAGWVAGSTHGPAGWPAGQNPGAWVEDDDPAPDVRSRPSPFRARPSLPLP